MTNLRVPFILGRVLKSLNKPMVSEKPDIDY
jgi:hypothetical protein